MYKLSIPGGREDYRLSILGRREDYRLSILGGREDYRLSIPGGSYPGGVTEVFDHVSSLVVSYITVVILTQIRGSYLSKVSSTEHSKVIVVLQSLQMRRHTREEQESKEKCILSWFLVPFFEH